MIRRSDWKKIKLIVVNFVIFFFGMTARITAQKLPSKLAQSSEIYYNEVDNAEIFKDSKVLKEGTEVNAYLLANETIKILFMVDEENNEVPLSLRITPCASAVESRVMRKTIPGYDDYGETPLFDIQDKPKVPEPANPTGVLLYSFTGPESHIFRRSSNTSGIYTVFIKPTESDTYVKLFLKSKPVAPSKDRDYPRLPRNSSIRVDRIRRKSFTVSWFPSQDETPYGNIITYCISVSPKRSFDNYCSLMSHKFGDKVPKNTGFFFPWEDDIVNLFRSKARPVKPAKPKDIFYTCVGRDTSYIFTQAKPGTKYNVNVYAINKQHNLSSAYKKLSVTSKKRKKRQRVKKLRNGKLQEVEFTKKKLEYNFKYVLKNTSDLYIAVHSCTGRVTFRVSRGHGRGQNVKKIIKKKVKRTSTFKVGNLEADTYFISVSSRKKDVPKTARLMVSTSQRKVRYPSLPRKANVFLVDNSTTHNSLTIGWLGTISRQKYCIYKKEILLTARRKRRRNQCSKNSESPVKDSTKVTCIVVRHEKPNMVLNHQIRNLKSKTSYQFDVVIQLGKGYTLLYNSLVASTKVHP